MLSGCGAVPESRSNCGHISFWARVATANENKIMAAVLGI